MYEWNVKRKYETDSRVIDLILSSRGLISPVEIQRYLSPPPIKSFIKELPLAFRNALKESKKLINSVIKDNIPIVIHGDYDADGICATAILYATLAKELSYEKTHIFIPNRFEHGYGLSEASVNAIIDTLTNEYGSLPELLVITVDSGITSVEEVEYLHRLNYKIILTDHHQKPENVPEADILLWDDKIVGASISWILSRVLGSKDPKSLALAALATVTDLQPLLNFNRTIVSEGLKIINEEPQLGLSKLIDISKSNHGEVSTYDLGWVIGPRLNASGRILDATEAVNLLIEEDPLKAEAIALKLNEINIERQDKTQEMYELAGGLESDVPKIIIKSAEDFHEGIIGLVAAKLMQKHYRPSIVISLEGEFGKGSVRSIPSINIIEVLREFEDLFVNVGGHPMAAGFSIKRENIEILEESLLNYAEINFQESQFVPVLDIDLQIPAYKIDEELMNDLSVMRPYGIGNHEPKFMTSNLGVVGVNYVGRNNNHITLRLYDGSDFYKAIMFGGVEHEICSSVKSGDRVDIVYKLKDNIYKGKVYIDLILEDIRLSEDSIN